MDLNERVRELVGPPLATHDLELVDVERTADVLRVTVDRPGGVDLDAIAEATRAVSSHLDRHDVVPGHYVLEVSSPGLERPLRTPEHFGRFVGTRVAVRTQPGTEGDRRIEGVLEHADDTAVVVGGRRLAYADIERARTVFEWGAPQKTTPKKANQKRAAQKRAAQRKTTQRKTTQRKTTQKKAAS